MLRLQQIMLFSPTVRARTALLERRQTRVPALPARPAPSPSRVRRQPCLHAPHTRVSPRERLRSLLPPRAPRERHHGRSRSHRRRRPHAAGHAAPPCRCCRPCPRRLPPPPMSACRSSPRAAQAARRELSRTLLRRAHPWRELRRDRSPRAPEDAERGSSPRAQRSCRLPAARPTAHRRPPPLALPHAAPRAAPLSSLAQPRTAARGRSPCALPQHARPLPRLLGLRPPQLELHNASDGCSPCGAGPQGPCSRRRPANAPPSGALLHAALACVAQRSSSSCSLVAPFEDACDEREDLFLHDLSLGRAKCLFICILCWRLNW